MTSSTAHSCLVDIFYHIRQVAARVAKLVLCGAFGAPFWDWSYVPFKRAMVVSYRLSIVTIALYLTIRYSAAIYRWMSPTFKSTKFEEETVDRCKSNLSLWKRYGAVVCKRNHADIFCRLSTVHERADRQTDRPRNGNIDSNRWNAFQRCRLIITVIRQTIVNRHIRYDTIVEFNVDSKADYSA